MPLDKLRRTDVGASAKNTARRNADVWAVVLVDVNVVGLEQTKAERVVEERQIVIHTAAEP